MDISYHFEFENGDKHTFDINIDDKSMEAAEPGGTLDVPWTRLENNKCAHCPLNARQSPRCPIANNLFHLVDQFKDMKSYWKTRVRVVTPQREYAKSTDLQSGMFSIFGLLMATSRCPHMAFLKPMARYHLPFSTMEETIVRTTSLFLLKQYVESKRTGEPRTGLKQLETHYQAINIVNDNIIARIRSIGDGDTHANAVVILDSFSQLLAIELASDVSGFNMDLSWYIPGGDSARDNAARVQ